MSPPPNFKSGYLRLLLINNPMTFGTFVTSFSLRHPGNGFDAFFIDFYKGTYNHMSFSDTHLYMYTNLHILANMILLINKLILKNLIDMLWLIVYIKLESVLPLTSLIKYQRRILAIYTQHAVMKRNQVKHKLYKKPKISNMISINIDHLIGFLVAVNKSLKIFVICNGDW